MKQSFKSILLAGFVGNIGHGIRNKFFILDCPSLKHTFCSTLPAIEKNIHNNYSTSDAEKNQTYFKCL